MSAKVMIMAGGTGGHVFPALAVAEALRERGIEVFWLGVRNSFEARTVPEYGIPMEWVNVQGLRGTGIFRWLVAPFKLGLALYQSLVVLRRQRPAMVLGMGGFVSGPGGVMARMLGIPLVIHEQNTVPGMTNQWLARVANQVLEAFPGSFVPDRQAKEVGNPVRDDIATLPSPVERMVGCRGPMRLLVLGGSQGAQILNEKVPEALAEIAQDQRPLVRHQSGRNKDKATLAAYSAVGVAADVQPFIDDMAEAYGWADLVICRSGALTISELTVVGIGAVLVPFPHAVDDHQTRNAAFLCDAGGAQLLPQSELTGESLAVCLSELLNNPEQLQSMAAKARTLVRPESAQRVADVCEEVIA